MRHGVRRRIGHFLHGMDSARRVILNILFWGILLIIVLSLVFSGSGRIKDGSVLTMNPYGSIVDAYSDPLSYRGLPVGYAEETLLSDLLEALERAADDRRITGIWISLDSLYSVGAASAGELADGITAFRASGKPVVVSADTYDTGRYRIASAADYIVVDRLGEVFPAGYGYWRAYYAEGLEKLGGEAHLFRSGESKSAGEPMIRDSMSDLARSNEERLLGDLWNTWLEGTSRGRGLKASVLEQWIADYDIHLADSMGNGAQAAKDAGLVDEIYTGDQLEPEGWEAFSLDRPRIDSFDYVSKPRIPDGAVVGVVPIVGSLVYGDGASGSAGSNDVIAALEQAREARNIAAIVLRIDSPGGDVRAAEEIRREVEWTRREWGIPVVASMGNLAASGGYWIAAECDTIIARSETITGSIGVYSAAMSFEKALAQWLGVRIDGVGTTPWSAAGHPGLGMDERTASLYREGVRDIDELFKNIVAKRRRLSKDDVDKLAGGIPWSGTRAADLGLVDAIGGREEAEAAAAAMAGYEEWSTITFDGPYDPREQMLGRLMWGRRAGTRGGLAGALEFAAELLFR